MRTPTLALLLALTAAGCTLGPNYVRPNVPALPAWRIEYPKAAEVANTKWWEQFGDPVLNDLIETSLRENLRGAQVAAARVEQFIGALTSHAVAGLAAGGLRRRREHETQASRVGQPARPGAERPVVLAVPGLGRRLVAARSLRPRAPPERGGPGAGLRQRAGASAASC